MVLHRCKRQHHNHSHRRHHGVPQSMVDAGARRFGCVHWHHRIIQLLALIPLLLLWSMLWIKWFWTHITTRYWPRAIAVYRSCRYRHLSTSSLPSPLPSSTTTSNSSKSGMKPACASLREWTMPPLMVLSCDANGDPLSDGQWCDDNKVYWNNDVFIAKFPLQMSRLPSTSSSSSDQHDRNSHSSSSGSVGASGVARIAAMPLRVLSLNACLWPRGTRQHVADTARGKRLRAARIAELARDYDIVLLQECFAAGMYLYVYVSYIVR
jgi:hypothetical protein